MNINKTIKLIRDIWPKLEELKLVEQRSNFHPEGNAFNHSIQVFNHALREAEDIEQVIAALTHDISKSENMLSHDKLGAEYLDKKGFSERVVYIVLNHLRIEWLISGRMKRHGKMKSMVESPDRLKDLVLIRRWDVMGRNPNIDNSKVTCKQVLQKLENFYKDTNER